jgi:hypothetical protein
MGWKRIGNHEYFHTSRREGGRVVTEYDGRGELAALCARLDDVGRKKREDQRAREKAEREAAAQQDREFREWYEAVETLAAAAMLAAGYHNHHGQWRRRRNGED